MNLNQEQVADMSTYKFTVLLNVIISYQRIPENLVAESERRMCNVLPVTRAGTGGQVTRPIAARPVSSVRVQSTEAGVTPGQ